MGVYTYPESSLISEITFRKSEGGQTRAYLQAREGADPAVLHEVTCKLADQGWHATPYSMDGKATLEVLGFGKEQKLQAVLNQHGWVAGTPNHVRDVNAKLSLAEQIKKRSLAASGAFYVVGDSAFTRYGYKGADKLNMTAGIMYGAGTLSLLGFGRKDQSDLQVEDIAGKLEAYLKEKGDQLPESCSLESIASDHQKGLIKKADDVFRRYPSEMMNIFYAVAGALIAKSAHNHMHKEVDPATIKEVFERKRLKNPNVARAEVADKVRKFHVLEGKLDIGLGAMTAASGLFATAIKEKAPDPDAPEKHGMAKVWEKIQQKPLAIAGVGYMVSTMCHAVSTAMAWNWSSQERRDTVGWRATFVGANIIAEILLAISSKGHGHGVKSDGSVDNTIISLAAEAIVKEPPQAHEEMINHVAQFLGRRDVLAAKNDVVRKQLHEQVAAMQQNPWAMHGAKRDAGELVPAGAGAEAESWQAKISQPPSGPQPQLS